jgi:hypothetical protein
MSRSLRRALKVGKRAVIWLVTLPRSNAYRYYVEGKGIRKLDSQDFGSLPDAERWFDALEREGPLPL